MNNTPNLFLRRARMHAGLTQEKVAGALGVSVMTIHRWERGMSVPGAFQRARLCALLAASEAELGWATLEEELALMETASRLFDPCIPHPPILTGQHALLKAMQSQCVPSVLPRRAIGLTGLAGSGKTAVVAAFAHSLAVQRLFPGILWATVGQRSQPRRHFQRWASLLGLESLPEAEEEAQDQLRMAIGGQRMLIVLDDLWDAQDMLAYQLGPQCQYVLTTPQVSLAYRLCEVVYRPQRMTPTQALRLLTSGLPSLFVRTHRSDLQRVTQQVGNLPLALEVIGVYLRHEASTGSSRRIQEALTQLTQPTSSVCMRGGPEQRSVCTAIERSQQWLPPLAQQALVSLARQFLPSPATFAEQEAVELLQTQALSLQELDCLVDAGLVETVGNSRYQLHPVVAAYARLSAQVALDREGVPCVGTGSKTTI